MAPKLVIKLQMCLLLAAALIVEAAEAKVRSASQAMPGCNETCGEVTIPYPFGMGKNCFFDDSFEIECRQSPTNHSSNMPFLFKYNVELIHVDMDRSPRFLRVAVPPLSMCSSTADVQSRRAKSIDLSDSPFTFPVHNNVFMVEGCPGSAVLVKQSNIIRTAGCGTVCHSSSNKAIPTNTCVGVQCCQTPLTSDSTTSPFPSFPFYEIDFRLQSSDEAQNCLVATLVDRDLAYKHVGDISISNSSSFPPVYLYWTLPNNFVLPRHRRYTSCGDLSCSCDNNYSEGNPYVPDGCQAPEGCEGCWGSCLNQQNSTGYVIPDKHYCDNGPLVNHATILGLSNGFGLLVLVAWFYGLYRFIKRRREMKRRAKFFKRNGGLLLQQQLSSNEGLVERTKIFTTSELDKATDHFNENRILGQGGQGTVYKGMLADGSIVAIKKAKLLDESQLQQFINEVVVLSRINHRHVVKLFGCCLETEVPLLVYEFVPNGTLYEHIHDPEGDFAISWEMRLKIAADSAGAIAYLHSSSSIPIYHRDIKSSNILLDEKYRAKVSDFGSSKTIAMDQTHMTTLVQGTMGYLDPEYFQSYQFTDKSDVYSFGVVILEFLTSKKSIYRDGSSMEQKNLVTEFLFLSHDTSRLSKILDPKIVGEAKEDELIAVVELAKRCVCWSGKMRPTMKEVAMTLEMIIKSPEQVSSWYQQQEAFPIQYAAYDEFDMSGVSDAEFTSIMLPKGDVSPPYSDERPILLDAS